MGWHQLSLRQSRVTKEILIVRQAYDSGRHRQRGKGNKEVPPDRSPGHAEEQAGHEKSGPLTMLLLG